MTTPQILAFGMIFLMWHSFGGGGGTISWLSELFWPRSRQASFCLKKHFWGLSWLAK